MSFRVVRRVVGSVGVEGGGGGMWGGGGRGRPAGPAASRGRPCQQLWQQGGARSGAQMPSEDAFDVQGEPLLVEASDVGEIQHAARGQQQLEDQL